MFLSNTSFSVKLQPIDWRSASLLDKEGSCLIETFPKFYTANLQKPRGETFVVKSETYYFGTYSENNLR